MSNTEQELQILKVFSDEKRLKILNIIKYEKKCACELLEKLDISQSTLSHHMKIMVEAGIVDGCKKGKWMHYSINKDGINRAKAVLDSFLK